MPRQKRPTYQLHKATGQAKVRLDGKDFYLGKYGTQASRDWYRELLSDRAYELDEGQTFLTIDEVALLYLKHAEGYYIKAGRATSEADVIRSALRPLIRLYGRRFAHEFRGKSLRRIRDEMISLGWKRGVINGAISRIRRMFQWAADEDLVRERVVRKLKLLPGLKKGRTVAPESLKVRPVEETVIEATLPFVPRVVADMIRVQRLTGMRPGEVCRLRPGEVNRTGEICLYEPSEHKLSHQDQERRIWIGPRAQEILKPYLDRPLEKPCFSPVDAEEHRRLQRHSERKTPLHYGNRPGTHRQVQPRRAPQHQYTTTSYARAIKRGCELAFLMPENLRRPSKG